MTIQLQVNGRTQAVDADPATPLLYVLRDDLQLNAAKFGCGLGQCGACTVMVGGAAVLSCLTPLSAVGTRAVKTVEGLGTVDKPGVLQRNPSPSEAEIPEHMAINLCRCGTHMRILRAVRRAAKAMGGGVRAAAEQQQ